MNSTINDTIDTLNHLTEILKDSELGFKAAAKDVKSSELAALFTSYAAQRAHFASTLQAHVSGLGADIAKSGSIAGSLHRGWINLKTALATDQPHAVLVEAERGEDVAVAAYEEALEHDLDQPTRVLLTRQQKDVKAAHDNIRSLRDSGKFAKKA